MRKVCKVQSFERDGAEEWVLVDLGGGDTRRVRWVTPSGDDSPPRPGDYVALVEDAGKGSLQAVGTTDATTKEASEGEKRLYVRDENGIVVGSIWLKSDGTVVGGNAGGTIQLSPDGVLEALCPDVRLGESASRKLAGIGDGVAVTVPILVAPSGGGPCVMATGTPNSEGTYPAVGRILSGCQTVKGGP